MKKFCISALTAALAFAGVAHAAIIDFENVDSTNAPFAPLLSDRDYVTQGGFSLTTFDATNDSIFGTQGATSNGGLVGALLNGSDYLGCFDQQCPSGDASNFLALTNDGALRIQSVNGDPLRLGGFSVASFPGGSDTNGSLLIYAFHADGTFAQSSYSFSATQQFQTVTLADLPILSGDGDFNSDGVTHIDIFPMYCPPAVGIINFCFGSSTNKAQIAIDDIILTSAVPEPSGWLPMAAGLGLFGYATRRRWMQNN